MLLNKNPKRACIYFIYDKDGVIDDYIIHQLRAIRKNVVFLHCVINGRLTPDGRVALSQIADEVYVRENKGNDIGAYKAAIEYVGWNNIKQYDELVLMNNTCFGPVYPFEEVFQWAERQDVDFWGLTWDQKSDWLGSKKYLHYNDSKLHIQSYFLVIRKTLLESRLLVEFFNDIPEDSSYVISGCVYEYAFPGYFEERGYKGGVYCDDKEDLDYPLLHNPVSLLKKYRMPLFKKRSFFHHYTDVLNHTAGEATCRLIDFLENETEYDMKLIWKSILRTSSLSDLVRCAQLNRILPRNFSIDNRQIPNLKVGLVYHAYYEDMFDEDIDYISNFPATTNVLVTTNTEGKRQILENKLKRVKASSKVVVIENRGRDVSSLLVEAKSFVENYDLICFAHDKKSSQVKPYAIGRSWANKLNENTFATKEYVENVIKMFSKEECLGIAFPSAPNHGQFGYTIGTGWSGNFENTKKLLKDFNVDVKINEHTLCVAPFGTCFWFRPEALKKLYAGYDGKGWEYKDFPKEPNRWDQTIIHAIERSYAYFAQEAGYYPVYIYNDKYAEIEFTNLEFQKVGSTEMRAWVDKLAMDSLRVDEQEDFSKGNEEERTVVDITQQYFDRNINFGIKRSLIHLAYAISCKYPRFWRIMLPFRRIGQKVLRIKTR